MQTFTIRPAVVSDAREIAQLSDMLGYPATEAVMASRLQHLMGRDEDIILVAALPSGQVIGWLHGAEQSLLEYGRRCEILGLVVDAQHRGQRVGRQLVAAVEVWALGRGLTQASVRSNVKRTESHPFYERLGYVRTKTQHAYRKELAPAPGTTNIGEQG